MIRRRSSVQLDNRKSSVQFASAIFQTVDSFNKTTTIAGPKWVSIGPNKTSRFLRLIVFLGTCVVFTYLIVDQVRQYMQNDTVVRLRVTTPREMPFPAVTICNLNPFRASQLRNIPVVAALVSRKPHSYIEYINWTYQSMYIWCIPLSHQNLNGWILDEQLSEFCFGSAFQPSQKAQWWWR